MADPWTAPIRWAVRFAGWIGKWIYLLRFEKRRVHAAAAVIANELEYNAHVAERAYSGHAMTDVQGQVHLEQWRDRAAEAHSLSKSHPELWDEVSAACSALQRTQAFGALPPNHEHLLDLARRLKEARY
jgi:hypothetical protein